MRIGLALLAAYVLSAFLPPQPAPVFPPGPHSTILERLFPGVPGAWIVLRLAALAAGAFLTTRGARNTFVDGMPAATERYPGPISGMSSTIPLAIALASAAQPLVALRAEELDRAGQLLFALGIPLPAVAVWMCTRQHRSSLPWKTIAAVLGVLLLGAATHLPIAWRSAQVADIVDGLSSLDMLAQTLRPDFNLLTDTTRPGQSALYLVADGGGFLNQFGAAPTIPYLQAVHALGALLTTALVAALAARAIGAAAAPVAAAAFLFSPTGMLLPMLTAPLHLPQALTALALLLWISIARQRSPGALAGIGAVAGVMGTIPSMLPLAVILLVGALFLSLRRPRIPIAAALVALASFAAVMLPGAAALGELDELLTFYSETKGQWSTLEATYFGQINPELALHQMRAGWSGPLDPLLATLALPFATPRTAMRLIGDSAFEPLATALAAIGIGVCLRSRRTPALSLLALLALTAWGGLVAGYDRISIMRTPALPVPLALLAAVGMGTLRRRFRRSGLSAGVGCALLIAVSGWTLTHRVQPTVLARSTNGIELDALSPVDARRAVLLIPHGWDPPGTAVFAAQLPEPPLRWRIFEDPSALERSDGQPVASLLLWSPGLEEKSSVAREICRRWPQAALYWLSDGAGLSRSYAARPDGSSWTPALPRSQWQVRGCATPLDTEERRARVAMSRATTLLERGEARAAIDLLRRRAKRTFVQVDLFDMLAHSLLEHGRSPAEHMEAVRWAKRAVQVCNGCLDAPVETLLAAYRRQGWHAEARRALAEAKHNQQTYCRYLRDGHPWKRASAPNRETETRAH